MPFWLITKVEPEAPEMACPFRLHCTPAETEENKVSDVGDKLMSGAAGLGLTVMVRVAVASEHPPVPVTV